MKDKMKDCRIADKIGLIKGYRFIIFIEIKS